MASAPSNGRSQAVQLGADLREQRKRANGGKGMTVAQVAAALGFHHSTVSRWERGETMPSEADTASVLAIYGVTGEERGRLVELARHDDIPDWVAPGIGKQLAALIEYERIADRITEVNPLLIPGLLQTRDYARSLMIGAGAPLGQAEQGAVIRMGRQNVLTRHKPVTYTWSVPAFVNTDSGRDLTDFSVS
ncbi:MAG TPA: Scr1 family TA system antitoxin-like transcriptional regulator [Pseudonocardiaceae bacterium]|jgi:transcriptional regulator with XRE-family HTH domain|nr:Scr1 family TA system antitoxin-like transcriptional regulator [Pseudonocardiaceae bacterium]